jgi:prepilin-type processing-associated H-X9-DG protein
VLLYARDHNGKYPLKLDDLLEVDINPEVLVCPESNDTYATGATTKAVLADLAKGGHCSYVYLGAGLSEPCDPAMILAHEKPGHHNDPGMNVLFGDGHVEWVDGKEAAYIRSELSKGFNPPRPKAGAATRAGK